MQFLRNGFRLPLRQLSLIHSSRQTLLRCFSEKDGQSNAQILTGQPADRPVAPPEEVMKQDSSHETKSNRLRWKDFRMITKIDLSLLNTMVALAGYSMFPGSVFLSMNTLYFCTATQLMAMASQAINQIIERSYDKEMTRTCMRPLPRNKLTTTEASVLSFGLWAGASGLFYLTLPIGGFVISNAILASYTMIYTPMKRTSEHNTAVGALVGAFPPLLGWVSAGGALAALQPWVLVLFIFSWQFPHFYGILWTYRKDYDTLEYKMVQDPMKASKIMQAAIAGQALSYALLAANDNLFVWFFPLMGYSLYMSYMSIKEFEKNQSISSAKSLKSSAYKPFTIFFLTLLLSVAGGTLRKFFDEFTDEKGK